MQSALRVLLAFDSIFPVRAVWVPFVIPGTLGPSSSSNKAKGIVVEGLMPLRTYLARKEGSGVVGTRGTPQPPSPPLTECISARFVQISGI
jgi:hypothetical protein